jgi:hypothetical protein
MSILVLPHCYLDKPLVYSHPLGYHWLAVFRFLLLQKLNMLCKESSYSWKFQYAKHLPVVKL